MLPSRLLMIHDTSASGQDNVAELTRGKQLDNPLLEVAKLDVVSWADAAGLVDPTGQLDDDLAVAV
jgi:hypothetical protein